MNPRTCIVTKNKAEKSVLFRFTAQEGVLVFDGKKAAPGRGAYVMKDEQAIRKLPKLEKKIAWVLRQKVSVPPEALEQQIELLRG